MEEDTTMFAFGRRQSSLIVLAAGALYAIQTIIGLASPQAETFAGVSDYALEAVFVAALLLIAGLAAGAAVVGGIPQAGDAGVSQATMASLPAVTLDKFEGGEVRVKAGETVALRLENPDGVAHTFTVDELGVDALMPAGKNSLALFKPTKPGTYTFYCIPHYDKASGQGMHGTLVVE